jgi:hypothetical protein
MYNHFAETINDVIRHCDENQFANGQSCRDLRVRPEATEGEIQPIE